MAGIMDPNDIQGVAEAMEELRKNGTLSAEALAKLGGNSTTAYKALEGYTKGLLGATSAVGGMARAVAQGEGSFSSLGSSISGLTGVMGKLASAIPLVGGAAKALAEGVGEAAKFVLDQLDTMAKNYQTLGDASATAADGIDGLERQFNELGNFSLPGFAKAVKANTLGLAALRGTAATGAEELSKVAGALTTGDTAKRFLRLGIGLEAVGEATTEYLATSARFGLLQGATTEELTKKTQNYIEEVDKIARLTGQTREAQQTEARKSLVQVQFRAKIADMVAKGQTAAAQELKNFAEGMGGAAGDAVRMFALGIPLSKDTARANLFSNDAIRQNTLATQRGKKAIDAIADTTRGLAGGAQRFGSQLMVSGDVFGGVALQGLDAIEIIKEQNKSLDGTMTRQQAIAAIAERQAEAAGESTEGLVSAQLATANSSKQLQRLGFTLTKFAIPAIDLFADQLDKATGFLNRKFGTGSGTVPSRRDDQIQTVGSSDARKKAEKYLGKKMSDAEFDALIRATHAEAGAGKQASQQEQAMIMASILNRARSDPGSIMGALEKPGAFQAVTGAYDKNTKSYTGPSEHYLKGPAGERLRSIEGATTRLENISRQQKDFTAASAAAYGPGTNIGYRDQMLASGGRIIGGSVFRTGPTDQMPASGGQTIGGSVSRTGPTSGYTPRVQGATPDKAGSETTAQGSQAAGQQQTGFTNDRLVKQLAELNQTSRELLAVNKKILQRQQ
jgi:hypothetical protein